MDASPKQEEPHAEQDGSGVSSGVEGGSAAAQDQDVKWEEVYDDLILTALRQPFSKDRALLLAADTELQGLLSDPEATQVPFERFGTLNSFQRLLLHRLGDAYNVKRVMVPISISVTPEPNAQPLPNSHLVLSKTPDSNRPALKLSEIATKVDAERPPMPAVFTSPTATTASYQTNSSAPTSPLVSTTDTRSTTPSNDETPSVRIMSRQGASSAQPSGASSRTSSACGKDKRPGLTLEQREAAYLQARERIFREEEEAAAAAAALQATERAPKTPSQSRPSSATRRSRDSSAASQHPRLRPSAPAFDPTGGPSGFVFYPPTPSTSSAAHLPPPPEGYEYPPSPPLDPEEQHAHLYEYTRRDPVMMQPSPEAPQGYFVVPPAPQNQGYAMSPEEMQVHQHPGYEFYQEPPAAGQHYQHMHQTPGYYGYNPPQQAPGPRIPTRIPPSQPSQQPQTHHHPGQPVYYYTVASTQPPPAHLQGQPVHVQHTAPHPAQPRHVPFPTASETASNASSSASTAEHASVGYELRPSSSSSSINSHPSLSSAPTLGSLGHPLVARAASEISAASSSVSSTGSSRTSKTAASSFSSSSKPISLGPGLPPLGPMKENYNKPARSKRNKKGGQRSNASQASDDLASERLSEAGSIGIEREPYPLPSRPDWIKSKTVRKSSSSSSRAASVSSALSNSANST